MTIANLGRLIKKAANMILSLSARHLLGCFHLFHRVHRPAGNGFVKSADDDFLACREAGEHCLPVVDLLAGDDLAFFNLVVLVDHVDEMVFAVGHQRGDVDGRKRFVELFGQFHGDVSAGNQVKIRIRRLKLQHQRAGVGIDPVVDEVEFRLLVEFLAVGAEDFKLGLVFAVPVEMTEEIRLTHRKFDLDRVVADDRRQRSFFRGDVVSLAVDVRTDFPGERGVDLRIGEIVFRKNQCGFRLFDFRLVILQSAQRTVVSGFGGRLGLDQFLVTVELLFRKNVLRLHLREHRLRGVDVRVVDGVFDFVKQIALFDHAAFLERPLLKRT